jgi:hypothetical protein
MKHPMKEQVALNLKLSEELMLKAKLVALEKSSG